MAESKTNLNQDYRSCAITCLQARHTAEAAVIARRYLAVPSFDLARFMAFVRGERIWPLLHDAVCDLNILPSEASEVIQKNYLRSLYINDRRWTALKAVLERFGVEGIPVILLKGAALMGTLYEKKGLRPMDDMDLLVWDEDFQAAGQALISCGYQPGLPSALPADAVKEISYHKPGQRDLVIDLHRSLFSPPHELTNEQMDWFWDKIEADEIEGIQAQTFTPTAQLLHLCAHLWLHHGGSNLLWECDIDTLIRRHGNRIDWYELIEAAAKFDLLIPLQKMLPEMVENWQSPVPHEVLIKIGGMQPSMRELRKFGKPWNTAPNFFKTITGSMLSYPTWSGRLHYMRILLFPPRKYIVERYRVGSQLLVPYFYMYRLVSTLIQQVGRTIFRTSKTL